MSVPICEAREKRGEQATVSENPGRNFLVGTRLQASVKGDTKPCEANRMLKLMMWLLWKSLTPRGSYTLSCAELAQKLQRLAVNHIDADATRTTAICQKTFGYQQADAVSRGHLLRV